MDGSETCGPSAEVFPPGGVNTTCSGILANVHV